ncbi:hypothetical protein H4W79_003763 [Nocardiopsis terrae]|uniref:Uncharacterized protein n=1 Tax=Nocardiopsis terrae TaxID=372655 RepID=A0ABR9HKJ6_9ACTN|nr:hypothetical protein [Nocardiopsis terrae]
MGFLSPKCDCYWEGDGGLGASNPFVSGVHDEGLASGSGPGERR